MSEEDNRKRNFQQDDIDLDSAISSKRGLNYIYMKQLF